MIIRSQDKKSIINFDNLEAVKLMEIQLNTVNNLWDFEIRYYNFKENGELLGIYSTYEKAIKVLDMIQEAYSRMEDIKCGAVQAQKYDSFCFQIPSDEDVEV